MENKAMCSGNQNLPQANQANVESDLWAALVEAEGVHCSWQSEEPLTEDAVIVEENPHSTITYPWDVTEIEAEPFFTQLEQDSIFDGWQSEEVSVRSNAFFTQLDHLWATAAAKTLQVTLAQRFAARIPQNLLAAIAHRAQHAVSSSLSLADQLVQCVQDLLPGLTELVEDDLYVLARPLAGAMRDGIPAVESTLAAVRPIDWDALSETEKARLGLVIARCALSELENNRAE